MSDTDIANDPTPAVDPAPAPSPSPQPSPREQFLGSLPEEYRADPAFARFNGLEDLAKSYSSASKMVGMDKNQIVAVPKDDDEKAWGAVWDKLGRPESADKYNIEPYKDIVKPDELKPYMDEAHKAGITGKQFDAVFGKYLNDAAAAAKAAQEQEAQQVGQWQQEIKTEYGAAYDQKMAFARKAVEKFGLSDAIKANPAIFEQPAIIKAFVEIGEKTSEGIVLSNGETAHGALSPNEAIMELSKFNSDPSNIKIMTDKRHPQHEFMMQRRRELYNYAYPQK